MAPTIGILHFGELGAALSDILLAQGFDILTTAEGRSEGTRTRVGRGAAEVCGSLDEVVARSEVIVSTVLPSAALPLAQACAAARQRQADVSRPTFLDINSIGGPLAQEVAGLVEDAGFAFVSGSVHGRANRLSDMGVLYLSGADAPRIAGILGPALTCQVVGETLAAAKNLKLLMGGMAKGLNMLFLEVALASWNAGLYEEFREAFTAFYPDLDAVVERSLTTFPLHAPRRLEELADLVELAGGVDRDPSILKGARMRLLAATDRWGETSLETIDDLVRAAMPARSEE